MRKARYTWRGYAWPAAWLFACMLSAAGCERGAGEGGATANPDVRRFWSVYDVARSLYAAGDFAKARPRFEEALRLRPDHPGSLYSLAHIELTLGHPRRAIEILERLKAVDPMATKAYLLAAAAWSDPAPGRPFDLEKARKEVERAEAINPEDTGVILARGRLALLEGDLERAAESFSTAARVHAAHAEASVFYALAEAARGEFEKARGILDDLLSEHRSARIDIPSEGDTRSGQAGALQAKLLEARWLSELVGRALEGGDPKTGAPFFGGTHSGRGLAASDFDGDGFEDVAAGRLDGPAVLYRGSGSGPDAGRELPFTGADLLIPARLDGDPRPDLIAIPWGHGAPSLPAALYLDAEGGWKAEPLPGPPRRTFAAAAVDLDGDGRTDVLEGGAAEGTVPAVRVIRNLGGRRFRFEPLGAAGSGTVTGLAAERHPQGEVLFVLLFAEAPPKAYGWKDGALEPVELSVEGPRAAAVFADLEGDGERELVLARPAGRVESLAHLLAGRAGRPSLEIFQWKGRRLAPLEDPKAPPLSAGIWTLAAVDLDRDGREEVAAASGYLPWRLEGWWRLRQSEAGRFEVAAGGPDLRAGLCLSAAAAADLDGDGRRELILSAGAPFPGLPGRLLRIQIGE